MHLYEKMKVQLYAVAVVTKNFLRCRGIALKKGYSFRLKYDILPDMKKSLLETNPYLKDPEQRKKMLRRSIISSSAIEGIVIEESDLTSVNDEGEPSTAGPSPKSD